MKNNIKPRIYHLVYLIAFVILLHSYSFSQQKQVVRDFGVRAGIEYEHEIKGPFTLKAMVDIRTSHNSSKIDANVLDIEFSHKISKHFDISTHARYTLNTKKDGFYYHDLRNDYDLNFDTKISEKIKFKYRFRYQYKYANLLTFSKYKYDPGDNSADVRHKVKFDYELNETHKPYISFEIFQEHLLYRRPSYNQFRINLGDQWKINTKTLSLGFLYERDWSKSKPFNFFIIKTYYEFSRKKK